MVKVGVVILNYKTYKDTIRLVNDLLSFEMKDELQIMVVDNYSPNESFVILKKELYGIHNVKVIQSDENGGYAKGNNIGLRALKEYNPEYALILNNDVYFTENTLKNCIDSYQKLSNVGQISPLQMLPNKKIANLGNLKCNTFVEDILNHFVLYHKFSKRKIEYLPKVAENNVLKVDIIPGCFIFIRFKLFESIGFYDEDTFLFCEERFLYKKLSDIGYHNYLLLDDAYIHDHSLTIKKEVDIIRQKKLYNDGQVIYTKKYRTLPGLKSFLLRCACKLSELELFLIFFINRLKNHESCNV